MELFLKCIFSLYSQIFENGDKSNFFMISSIVQALFKINIQPKIWEHEKKRQRIYNLFNTETKFRFLCLPYPKQNIFFFYRKVTFKEKRGVLDLKNEKKAF